MADVNPQPISAEDLKAMLASPQPPFVLDVREPYETASGIIPGAHLMPMNTVPTRLQELPPDRTIVVVCHLGERSWVVAQFLARRVLSRDPFQHALRHLVAILKGD